MRWWDARFADVSGQHVSSCCHLEQKGEGFCSSFCKWYSCQVQAASREQQGQCSNCTSLIRLLLQWVRFEEVMLKYRVTITDVAYFPPSYLQSAPRQSEHSSIYFFLTCFNLSALSCKLTFEADHAHLPQTSWTSDKSLTCLQTGHIVFCLCSHCLSVPRLTVGNSCCVKGGRTEINQLYEYAEVFWEALSITTKWDTQKTGWIRRNLCWS